MTNAMNNLAETLLETIGACDTLLVVSGVALLLLTGLIFEDETYTNNKDAGKE